jgi:hypothetical protein
MPHERVTKTMVWTFDELSPAAKAKARDKWRETQLEYDWWDGVYDDAERCGKLLGIAMEHRTITLSSGGTRPGGPSIWFSGFSSQGDGACFEGSYSYAKGCRKAIRKHAPKDTQLHQIADDLTHLQKQHGYRLEAVVKHSGHYQHSGCTDIEVFDREDNGRDIGDADGEIRDRLRSFMDWIYCQLEAEHDYQMSDEAIDESIKANEVEFYEDGRQA